MIDSKTHPVCIYGMQILIMEEQGHWSLDWRYSGHAIVWWTHNLWIWNIFPKAKSNTMIKSNSWRWFCCFCPWDEGRFHNSLGVVEVVSLLICLTAYMYIVHRCCYGNPGHIMSIQMLYIKHYNPTNECPSVANKIDFFIYKKNVLEGQTWERSQMILFIENLK